MANEVFDGLKYKGSVSVSLGHKEPPLRIGKMAVILAMVAVGYAVTHPEQVEQLVEFLSH